MPLATPADLSSSAVPGDNESQPRAKRIACVLCRKRKLRCDGARPKCATCNRLSHTCSYDEVRKKSGPKRGYVKLLEARLQQVETLLGKDDAPDIQTSAVAADATVPLAPADAMRTSTGSYSPSPSDPPALSSSHAIIGLGLEEALPPKHVMDELHDIYFEKLHVTMPMIHRARYLAGIATGSLRGPPICLRYIIWAIAATLTDKYASLAEVFYRRARKYADIDEMRGYGELLTTVAHCQTWALVSLYEFKHMYFPRAWQDAGRASSLAVMLGINRLDAPATGVKQCLPPAADWIELEERRRTFWMAFCFDRYASIGTGWAFRLEESDILTNLPASEQAFENNQPEPTSSLAQILSLSGIVNVSSISSVVVVACLLGRNLTHLHRPSTTDNEADLNGEFWQRHRQLEDLLASISLALPDYLRIPGGLPDPNVIFMNLLLHTAVICLHQAAIFKADQHNMPYSIIIESRARCMTGASEVTRIMKMLSHIDMSPLNPFMAFSLYVAARVFVQYLKWRPEDLSITASLKFLGMAMHIMQSKNPLTTSFLAQLQVDLEGTGIVISPKASSPWSEKASPPESERSGDVFVDRPPPRTEYGASFTPLIVRKPAKPLSRQTTESRSPADSLAANLPHRSKGQSPLGFPATLDDSVDMDGVSPPMHRNLMDMNDGSSGNFDFTTSQSAFAVPAMTASSLGLDEGMFFNAANSNFAHLFTDSSTQQMGTMGTGFDAKLAQGWIFQSSELGTGLTPMVVPDWQDEGKGISPVLLHSPCCHHKSP